MPPLHRAGRAMIASGVVGLLAFAALVAALYTRETTASQQQWAAGVVESGIWDTLFRGHDIGLALQMLLLLPAALSLGGHSNARAGERPAMRWIGAAACIGVALSLAMIFVLKSSDMLYMLPQGLLGVWLLWLALDRPPGLGTGLRILAAVCGVALVAVALACLGIALAIGPSVLTVIGPVPTSVDPEGVRSALNAQSHVVLDVGTVLGVLTLPVWSILAGRAIGRAVPAVG